MQNRSELVRLVRQFSRCTAGEVLRASSPCGSGIHSIEKLPTDSIGTFVLSLTNLVIGSAIRIEVVSTGTLVEYRVADTTTEVFNVPAYSVGSASNELRIKVRKGSAPVLYKPYETIATAVVGSSSVYIAQVPD
jgi:hypothetical protein